MNTGIDIRKYQEEGLKPHQAALVMDFLATLVPARRLLLAAPGLGKTTAAISLAKEIAIINPNYHILVVGPSALALMFKHKFLQAFPGGSIKHVNRAAIRELEAGAMARLSIWPTPFIAILNMDLASKTDVLDRLSAINWDLVVLEEVHLYSRSRWTLLKTILASKAFQRVLLIDSPVNMKGIASLIKNVPRMEWRVSELKDWDGQSLFAIKPINLNKVVYSRTREQAFFEQRLSQLIKELSHDKTAQLIKTLLLRLASSSFLALEETIRRMRSALKYESTKNSMIPSTKGKNEGLNNEIETDINLGITSVFPQRIWRNREKAILKIDALLDALDLIQIDAKFKALEDILEKLIKTGVSKLYFICIFCSFKRTADYLQTALSERYGNIWVLTGEKSPEQFLAILDGFKSDGGILIGTDSALRGVDLRYLQAAIHYDAASSNIEIFIRTSRCPNAAHYIIEEEKDFINRRHALT